MIGWLGRLGERHARRRASQRDHEERHGDARKLANVLSKPGGMGLRWCTASKRWPVSPTSVPYAACTEPHASEPIGSERTGGIGLAVIATEQRREGRAGCI